jgi:hypothetical protein
VWLASGQAARAASLYHTLPCDGPDAAKWLGKGDEADVEEAEKVGKVAADCCLDESEHSASPDLLDIQF